MANQLPPALGFDVRGVISIAYAMAYSEPPSEEVVRLNTQLERVRAI